MKTIYRETTGTCNFCKVNNPDVLYDGIYMASTWANACEDCKAQIRPMTKIVKRTKAKPNGDGKILRGILAMDLEDAIMDSILDCKCPACGDIRSVEPDAFYVYTCDGCGAKVKACGIC